MKFPRWKNRSGKTFAVGSQTHVGITRTENQDSLGVFTFDASKGSREQLFVVADGMGGHERGSEASTMAVEILRKAFFGDSSAELNVRLTRVFELANERIYDQSQRYGEGTAMGTTCTALAVSCDQFWIGHVGDSRAYRIEKEKMIQLTNDHTFVNELLREGILTEAETLNDPRRHNLVQAMGITPSIDPDIFQVPKPESGERLLICSDGLAVVSAEKIAEVVRTNDVQTACDELIKLANQQGGPDNISVVVIEVS